LKKNRELLVRSVADHIDSDIRAEEARIAASNARVAAMRYDLRRVAEMTDLELELYAAEVVRDYAAAAANARVDAKVRALEFALVGDWLDLDGGKL
jgi:hypothetical protein